MSKCYSKEFEQTILGLLKQGKSARQFPLEYEVGYPTLLKWVQDSK